MMKNDLVFWNFISFSVPLRTEYCSTTNMKIFFIIFVMDSKYKAGVLQETQLNEEQKQRKFQLIPSEYYDQYQKIVKSNLILDWQIEQKLALQGISYQKHYQIKDIQLEAVYFTKDDQILNLNVDFGKYRLQILLLNVFSACNLSFGKPIGVGQFGRVYSISNNSEEFAIKVFSLANIESRSQHFYNVVKQLSIMKICSAFDLCPSVGKYLGFDLIIFDDLAFFAMEKGIKIKNIIESQLLQMLNTMHSLQIVHSDLKPQNLIYSPSIGKTVFIDYGFSDIIYEKRGFKTLTKFKGTPEFSSPQMVQIFSGSRKDYIDLYYNDLYSLTQSIKQIKRQINMSFCEKEQFYNFPKDNQVVFYESALDRNFNSQMLMFIFKASFIKGDYSRAKFALNDCQQYLIKSKTVEVKRFFKKHNFFNKFCLKQFEEEVNQLEELTQIDSIKKDSCFVLQSFQILASQKLYTHSERQQSNHINLKAINDTKDIRSRKKMLNHLQYDQLLNKEVYQRAPLLYHLSLFECLRFDKKSNVDFIAKTKLAETFLFEFHSEGASNKQRQSQYKAKKNPYVPFLLVFEEISNYLWSFQQQQNQSVLFEVFYQLIIIDENRDGQLQMKLDSFLKRKEQRELTIKYMSVCWVWVKKYSSLLEIKTNFEYKEHQHRLLEYCKSYTQQIAAKIEKMNCTTLDKDWLFLRRLIIGLTQLEEDCALLYDTRKAQQFVQQIDSMRSSGLKVYLQFEFSKYLSEHYQRNYCFSKFSSNFTRLTQILLSESSKNSNNFFHLLITHFATSTIPINKYQQFQGHQKQIDNLLRANGIQEAFRMSYFNLFVSQEETKQYPKFIKMYINLKDHFFTQNHIRYLKYQFYFIANSLTQFLLFKNLDNSFYNNFSDIDKIIKRYNNINDLKHKSHQALTYNELLYHQVIINSLLYLEAKCETIVQLVDEHIKKLQLKLGYPTFMEEEVLSIVQEDWEKQLLYLQLLNIKIKRANMSGKNNTVLYCYKAAVIIYKRKGWTDKLLVSLNNIILVFNKTQNVISPPQCQDIYSICVKKNAISFLISDKCIILHFVLRLFIYYRNYSKIVEVFQYVLKELETCCSIFDMSSFIVNLNYLFQTDFEFFQSKNMLSIVESISPDCRYRVILLIFSLKRSQILKMKDENHSKIQLQLKRVISQVRPLIRQFIQMVEYSYRCSMRTESSRKLKWIRIKKGFIFMLKKDFQSYCKQFIFRQIAEKGRKKIQLKSKIQKLSQFYSTVGINIFSHQKDQFY